MLYEYAVIPDVFDVGAIEADPRLEVVIVELLRGMAGSGMLANLDKDRWARHVEDQRLALLAPGLRDRIVSCLTTLAGRNRLVRHPAAPGGRPQDDRAWLALAIESHRRLPFDDIIIGAACAAGDTVVPAGCTHIESALESPAWRGRRTTRLVRRTPGAFREQLEPVLRHARKVQLIEPNAAAGEERFWRILRICTSLLDAREQVRQVRRILELHTGDPVNRGYRSTEAFLSAWESEVCRLRAGGSKVTFRVFLWNDTLKSKRLHDRYILTDQCGIAVQHGLDTKPGSTETTGWQLLDEEDRQEIRREIDPAVGIFDLISQREIGPDA